MLVGFLGLCAILFRVPAQISGFQYYFLNTFFFPPFRFEREAPILTFWEVAEMQFRGVPETPPATSVGGSNPTGLRSATPKLTPWVTVSDPSDPPETVPNPKTDPLGDRFRPFRGLRNPKTDPRKAVFGLPGTPISARSAALVLRNLAQI